MANIFAAHDIALIAGAFRPAIPSTDKPSLVWNLANDRLLQSTKLVSRFSRLLNQNDDRVPVSSLSKTLDTRNTEWCIASHPQALIYSSDKQALVSIPETERLLSSILESAQKQYLELESFLDSRKLDRDSFKTALDESSQLQIIPDSKTFKTWIASTTLHTDTAAQIDTLLRNSPEDHKTDLSASLPAVPRTIIQNLAEQISQQHGIKGTVRSSKTRITFLSAAYEAMLADQRAKKIAREFSKILVQTHRNGYHTVPEDSEDAPGLRDVFFERTKSGLDDGSFSMLHSGERPIALAFTNKLEVVLNELKAIASDMTTTSYRTTGGTQASTNLNEERITTLIDRSSAQEFANLVLEDAKYRSAIEQSMLATLSELEGTDLQQSNAAFNDYVRLPIRLYLAGLNNVKDQSLRSRLEDYVLEYMSKDLIPTGIQHMQDEKHGRPKPVAKEVQEFNHTCLEATSLYELQTSLSKFVRKQKLESVSEADEIEVKQRILMQKLKAMRKMIRGSDILQNLVWILLAEQYEGLFISSGRDTTRMIRFYQASGDEDVGKKLEAWKDRFKAGQEAKEDFDEMRTLAETTVANIGEDRHADAELKE